MCTEKSVINTLSLKRERHFAIVLYTNMAVSSREWKPRIERSRVLNLLSFNLCSVTSPLIKENDDLLERMSWSCQKNTPADPVAPNISTFLENVRNTCGEIKSKLLSFRHILFSSLSYHRIPYKKPFCIGCYDNKTIVEYLSLSHDPLIPTRNKTKCLQSYTGPSQLWSWMLLTVHLRPCYKNLLHNTIYKWRFLRRLDLNIWSYSWMISHTID